MQCPNCKREVGNDTAYCKKCGARLTPSRPVNTESYSSITFEPDEKKEGKTRLLQVLFLAAGVCCVIGGFFEPWLIVPTVIFLGLAFLMRP
jgi:hypothetical protein